MLALEYAAGRRRMFVQPLRVLIMAIIIFVLVMPEGRSFTFNIGPMALSVMPASLPTSGSIDGTLAQIDRFGVLERLFTEKVGPVATAPANVIAPTLELFASMAGFLLIMFGVALWQAEYLVFALRRFYWYSDSAPRRSGLARIDTLIGGRHLAPRLTCLHCPST